jgi:hypothetical protein
MEIMRIVSFGISGFLVLLGILRLILGDKYPLKVRGKIVDSLIYFALAAGIFYLSLTTVVF